MCRIKLIFCGVLMIHHMQLIAQDSLFIGHSKEDGTIGPVLTVASFDHLSPKFGIGVEGEYMLGREFGLGSVICGGPDYFEVGVGFLGLFGLLLLQENSPGNFWGIFLLPLLIENPNIHFEPARDSEFVLSFSLCRIRYMWEENSYYDTDLFASGSIILRYTKYYRRNWNYSFFIEGTTLYHTDRPKGIQAGIALRWADK
jgi:hypothetical protein